LTFLIFFDIIYIQYEKEKILNMKVFRIFNIVTNETILFIKMKNLYDASNWIFKNYGDINTIDVEEVIK